jgi:hypothetical protein
MGVGVTFHFVIRSEFLRRSRSLKTPTVVNLALILIREAGGGKDTHSIRRDDSLRPAPLRLVFLSF